MEEAEGYLEKLNSFFLAVGGVDDYAEFAGRALTELGKLVPYDQAAGIFLIHPGR